MFTALRNGLCPLRVKQRTDNPQWQLQPAFHLCAAADAAETPVAEVLAVISQQPVITLTEARAGAPHNLFRRIS